MPKTRSRPSGVNINPARPFSRPVHGHTPAKARAGTVKWFGGKFAEAVGSSSHLTPGRWIRTSGSRMRSGASIWGMGAMTKWHKSGLEIAPVFRGTGSSNPSPSSEESANFRFLSKRRASEICRDTAHRYGLQPRSTLGRLPDRGISSARLTRRTYRPTSLEQGPLPPEPYEEAKQRLAAAGSAPQAGGG